MPTPIVYTQGQGAISADGLNLFVQTCDSVASARGVIGVSTMSLFLQGYATPGDGGQGTFYWNATSTAADDNGVTTIKPSAAAAAGRWIRIPAIAAQGLTPGTYTLSTVVVGAGGNITSVASGVGGAGTVTSVDVAFPASVFSVTGSPITTSGSIIASLANQNANLVFAGPTGGSAAPPTFRALVAADLPAGAGTVSSVAVSSSDLTVTGSPITTSGTITLNLNAGLVSAGTNTKVTINSKGLVTGLATATLASADYANQGAVGSYLQGNASGNPSWQTLTAALDAAFSSTQGSVLYRGASTWAALGPGTSGQKLQTNGAGANPTWTSAGGGIIFAQTNTVTVSNTITETTLSGTGVGSLTLPANALVAGTSVYIRAFGYHSAVTNPTLRIRVYFGTTVVADTTAITTANSTNAGWELVCNVIGLTTGVSGTVQSQGFWLETGSGANVFGMVNLAAVTLDTTSSQVIKVTAQWGTASTSDTITCTNLTVDVGNPVAL